MSLAPQFSQYLLPGKSGFPHLLQYLISPISFAPFLRTLTQIPHRASALQADSGVDYNTIFSRSKVLNHSNLLPRRIENVCRGKVFTEIPRIIFKYVSRNSTSRLAQVRLIYFKMIAV